MRILGAAVVLVGLFTACGSSAVAISEAIVGDWTALVVLASEQGPVFIDVTSSFFEDGTRELIMEGELVVPPQARYWFEEGLLILDGCQGVLGSYRASVSGNGNLQLAAVDDPCFDRVSIYQRDWSRVR